MQRTKSKLLSILLSLVMLLSLLPTTALAADYPYPDSVSVNGSISFSSSNLYYKNGETACSADSTGCNAAYDPTTGTLTLNGYDGGKITLGGDIQRDLTIKLIGNNKITVNGAEGIVATAYECNITITAESGSNGNLTIEVENKASAYDGVTGIGNYLATGGGTSGNVTITGYADVTINATSNTANYTSYGIYANKVVIEDHAKAAITVNAPSNTGGGFVYGIYAKDNVTINTEGEIMVDVSNVGTTDRVYSIGVYAQNSLTLTKVGGMTVKWNNNHGTNGHPLSPAPIYDSDAYDTNVTTVTNADGTKYYIATYTPKVAAANISLSETGTVDFGSKEAGYATAPTAKTVTITNNGTANTGALTIALDGANKTDFTLSKTSITDIAASGTDTFTVQPKTGLTADTYNATVKVSGTGVTEQSFDVKFTVTAPATPITDTLVSVSDLTGKTYNESAQEPTFSGSLIRDTDYTVSYAVKPGSTGTLDGGKPKDAGTYVVTVAGKGSYTGSFDKDFKIDKANPTYTAPAAKAGLAYTGSALDLIDAGTVTKGGKMQYKLSGGSYGLGIPTATDAGDYIVYYQITENDNYNAVAETQVGTGAINIAQVEWGVPTETLTPVNPTTAGGSDGQITGTTSTMQYKKSTDSSWADCSGAVTGLAAGTYYVRYKADSNHTASDTNYKTVTLTDPGATLYGVTVTDGTATPTGNQAAGVEVTITANAKTGFNFKEWTGLADSDYKTGFTKASNPATFIMPASNVTVTATYEAAALTGTVNITGTLKYGEELTATLTSGNNTGNLDYKWYQNGTTQVAANNTGKYTLRADDIGKTITVKVSSNVQTGEITSSATGIIKKADGPAAPTAFTLTFTPNADGTTFTATIPTVTGGEYSFDGTNYSATNTKADCAANFSYTGYVRIAATSTHEASTATSDTQTSPKLTVATPTFTPNGASSFTGMQSVTISCTTAGATIHYTTDGTAPTASSPVYSAALSLTSTTTVKAIAVKTDMNDSAIATATFTKYSGGGGGGGGSYTPSYTVSVDKTENGTITVSPKSASKGDTVTITVKPDKGYELEMLKALDKDGDALKLTEKNGKYTFKMPSGKVTVKGSFVEEAPVQIFKDVPVDAYYYEAVKWAAEKGITGGVGNGLFAPNQPCTRGQIVTFLWRAAGSPAPKNMSSFADVPADAFYAKAVAWAVENGITGGTGDGKFSPDATCTRAQSVTFLYRAAGSPKVSSSAEFGDVATNAYYADAVAWAAKNGITGGIGGGLFGSGNDCTRGQIVTFLYRAYNK